jgi:cyclopropane fatty-acyl-phospholipid synthase-like methyltransferase
VISPASLRPLRESGEALVQQFGIRQGMKVLDLGCGDGTTALPAAKLGADVLGVDIASNLVEAGNRRAKEMSLANRGFKRVTQPICASCKINPLTLS